MENLFLPDKVLAYMPTYKSYHAYLIESLKDPAEAASYLKAAMKEKDLEQILLALKNVAEALSNLTNTKNAK